MSSIYTLVYADAPHRSAAAAVASSSREHGSSKTVTTTSYSLVELSPALAKHASSLTTTTPTDYAIKDSILGRLVIKGQPHDDAVLCTHDTTYNIRAVQNSNSLLLCQPDKGKRVAIQDTLHQTLELEMVVPKLERLSGLLRGQEWSPDEDPDHPDPRAAGQLGADEAIKQQFRKRRRKFKYTKEDILELVPASDAQVLRALEERRILVLNGYCRPVTPSTLSSLLRNILNTLALLSATPDSFSLQELQESLANDDGVPREVTEQVVGWFGKVSAYADQPDVRSLNLQSIAREIGKEMLSRHGNKPIRRDEFVASWQQAVGEQHASACDMSILSDSFIDNPTKTAQTASSASILYFPVSSLPLDPASRFSKLFSVKPRWKVSEIAPFLSDLAVDSKKRDALTLKFTRKIKGEGGEMEYAARAK